MKQAILYLYVDKDADILLSKINELTDMGNIILELEPMNGVYNEEIVRIIYKTPFRDVEDEYAADGYTLFINRYNLESCYNDSRPNDRKSKKRFLQRLKAGKVEGCTWEKYVKYRKENGLEVIEAD